jgi:hypothetical protein
MTFDTDRTEEHGDVFQGLDAKDGFHVVKIEVGGNVSLHVQAYVDGGLADLGQLGIIASGCPVGDSTVEVKEWRGATEADQGEAERLYLVLDAVARYLTTGGNWGELHSALARVRKIAVNGLVFPGYHYSTGYSTVDEDGNAGGFEHLFVKDDGSGTACVWTEPYYNEAGGLVGGRIDPTDLKTIHKRQLEDVEAGQEPGAEPPDGGVEVHLQRLLGHTRN